MINNILISHCKQYLVENIISTVMSLNIYEQMLHSVSEDNTTRSKLYCHNTGRNKNLKLSYKRLAVTKSPNIY